jgi:hypothetical protein
MVLLLSTGLLKIAEYKDCIWKSFDSLLFNIWLLRVPFLNLENKNKTIITYSVKKGYIHLYIYINTTLTSNEPH